MKQVAALTRRAAIHTILGVSAGAMIGGCVPGPSPSRRTFPAGLSVHLAEQSSGPGLQPLSSPAATVYLHPEPLITSADTSLSRVLASPFGDYRVVVQLKDGVPDRLAPILREHQGGMLAISVDGRLVSTQPIDDSSFRGRLTIANNFSKEDAEAIARAI